LTEFDCADMEEPSEFLACNIKLIPGGKVLDLAMGGGRNAVFLAKNGFDVEGVDISREAVASAKKLAALHGVKIEAEVADLETGYKIAAQYYNCIICFNYLQRSLINDIKNGLKKGGVVIYETYIVDQAALGKPRNPDHLLEHNELLSMFRDFRCLRYREGTFEDDSGVKAIAGIVAVKT
jgi:tellurite methyltransferase